MRNGFPYARGDQNHIAAAFGQIYQGLYATLLMAKAGADVIKIEPPQGEPLAGANRPLAGIHRYPEDKLQGEPIVRIHLSPAESRAENWHALRNPEQPA